MEAIKLLNEAVDARLVLQLVTDSDDDFYYREYYLVSRGKEQILLLSSNEENYYCDSLILSNRFFKPFSNCANIKSLEVSYLLFDHFFKCLYPSLVSY